MYTLETWNDLKFDYILESPRKNIMGFLIFYHEKPGIIMGFFSNKVLRTLHNMFTTCIKIGYNKKLGCRDLTERLKFKNRILSK